MEIKEKSSKTQILLDKDILAKFPIGEIKIVESNDIAYPYILFVLLKNSLPTILYFMSVLCVPAFSLHFIGKLNNAYLLDAVGVGNTLINCTTLAIIVSLNHGLISLASQAYGAKNHILVGMYFQRAIFLNTIVLILCFVCLFFSRRLFLLCQMPLQTADYAAKLIIYSFGGLYNFMLFDTMKSYLIAQDIFIPQVFIQIIIATGHWFWCYLYIEKMGLDIEGVALAYTCTYGIGSIILVSYITIMKPRPNSWLWFSKGAIHNLWTLFIREISIGSMIYLEWIAFEITVLFSSAYTAEQMGGQIAFYTLSGILFYIPMSLGITMNAFTGNAIGEKNTIKLERYLKAGLFISIFIILIMEISLYLLKRDLLGFFTVDPNIIKIAEEILVIYLFALLGDAIKCILGGFIRGIGQEKIGSWAFFISFYAIALPICYILGNIFGYNVYGLRVGMGVGIYCILLFDVIIVLKSDYNCQVKIIHKRIQSEIVSPKPNIDQWIVIEQI